MATEEHQTLAEIIKRCHDDLRNLSKILGPEVAWNEHVQNTSRLQEYAKAMHQLASIWESNCTKKDLMARSRIKWTIEYCLKYFFTERIYLSKTEREKRLLKSWLVPVHLLEYIKIIIEYSSVHYEKIRLLDVGSCFNPFAQVPCFEVTAIDLCPATEDVKRGDFLKIIIDTPEVIEPFKNSNDEIKVLPANYFECIVFSLLLEYIPSSEQRILCCRKAYKLLKTQGILVIITPDSEHVGKNAKLMKQWQYTLARMGFLRIKFEKLPHITCMVFRKSICAYVAERWAEEHLDKNIAIAINIPQDKQ